MMIDLRSDTFTKPSPAMLEAMLKAAVGDDVFREDLAVNQLESYAAALFGMESALFCPSGTMTNQIAIKCHTQPGNEVICEKLSHVYNYEGGGIAFNSGCQVRALEGNLGRLTASQVLEAINPDDVHKAPTALVCVENTANRGGGSCYEIADLEEIRTICLNNNIKYHLDGARIWNAMIAKGESPKQYGNLFDSISICLSKGLGAPVGSLLLGGETYINNARRVRKILGGGMRQAGYLAAAGMFALEHNIDRLKVDHDHATMLGNVLKNKDFVGEIYPIETNIIIFEVKGTYSAQSFSVFLKKHNILCIPISANQVRMVTHLDVSAAMVNELIGIIEKM